MFYIDQLRTQSFPIGLVKTESGFIVRSVETALGRWVLVVAVVSVDAYPFWVSHTWNDLTQMINFPTRILDCDSHSPALLDIVFSSDASISSTMAFLPLENSDHVVVSVFIDFPSSS